MEVYHERVKTFCHFPKALIIKSQIPSRAAAPYSSTTGKSSWKIHQLKTGSFSKITSGMNKCQQKDFSWKLKGLVKQD